MRIREDSWTVVSLCICVLAMRLLAIPVTAAEYSIKPGDDVDAVIAKLKPGDVLVAAAGVYKKQWTISGLKGTADRPIVIRGAEGNEKIDDRGWRIEDSQDAQARTSTEDPRDPSFALLRRQGYAEQEELRRTGEPGAWREGREEGNAQYETKTHTPTNSQTHTPAVPLTPGLEDEDEGRFEHTHALAVTPTLTNSHTHTQSGPTLDTRDVDSHEKAQKDAKTVIRPEEGRDGILFWGGGGSEYVIVENIRVEGAERAGIVVNSSRHIAIRHCAFVSNGVWGIQTCLSDYVTIEDCEASGSKTQHGIYFSTTDHPIVRRSIIRGNVGCGIQMNGDRRESGDGIISDGIIEDNIISGNGRRGGAAINMDGVQSTIVQRNMVLDNLSGGITTFRDGGAKPGKANEFRENTVLFEPGMGRFGLELIDGATDIVSVSNILVCGNGPALVVGSTSRKGLVSDGNVYYVHGNRQPIQYGWRRRSLAQWREVSGQDMNSTVADRKFVAQVRTEAEAKDAGILSNE